MLVWLALVIAIASVIVSATYGTLRGLEAFRAVKSLAATVGAEIDRIAVSTAEIELHLAEASAAGSRLDRSLARLRASRARLNVLRSAIDEVRAAVGSVTGLYPSK